MDSISITSYSAQLRMYSGSAEPSKPKLRDTSSGTSSEPASRSCDFRSKDGDSFSMSLEARIVQISMTSSEDGTKAGGKGTDGVQGISSQDDGSFGSGLVKALMQALGEIMGNDEEGGGDKADSAKLSGIQGHGHRHHLGHRRMEKSYLA